MDKVLLPHNSPNKQTIFHAAVQQGAVNCLKYLIRKFDTSKLNTPDADGRTPLHYCVEAAYHSNEQKNKHTLLMCMKFMMRYGFDVNARDRYGDTALHNICQMNMVKPHPPELKYFINYVELLLSNTDIHVTATNKSGKTPLDYRSLFGESEIYNSHILKRIYVKVESPGPSKVIDLLYNMLIAGPNINDENSEKLKKTQTLTDKASEVKKLPSAYLGCQTILYCLIEQMDSQFINEILNEALKENIELHPWLPNVDDQQLPLHAALRRGNPDIVRMLLSLMKRANPAAPVDLTKESFRLLRSLLCNTNSSKRFIKDDNINHYECLKKLFEDSVQLDIDQGIVDQETDTSIDAHYLATACDLKNERKLLQQKQGKMRCAVSGKCTSN